MPLQGRSNSTLWIEVLALFDAEDEQALFVRAVYDASPKGIRVMDQWVWEKYLRFKGGITIMAKSARTPAERPQNATQSFLGFINYDLTDEQFDAFDKIYPRSFPSVEIMNAF